MAIYNITADNNFFHHSFELIKQHFDLKNNNFSEIVIILPNERSVRFFTNYFKHKKIAPPTIKSLLEYNSASPNKIQQISLFNLFLNKGILAAIKTYPNYYSAIQTLIDNNISQLELQNLLNQNLPQKVKNIVNKLANAFIEWENFSLMNNNITLSQHFLNNICSILEDSETKKIVLCGFEDRSHPINTLHNKIEVKQNCLVIKRVVSNLKQECKNIKTDNTYSECEYILKSINNKLDKKVAIISQSVAQRKLIFNYLKANNIVVDLSDGVSILESNLFKVFLAVAEYLANPNSITNFIDLLILKHPDMINIYKIATKSMQIFIKPEDLLQIASEEEQVNILLLISNLNMPFKELFTYISSSIDISSPLDQECLKEIEAFFNQFIKENHINPKEYIDVIKHYFNNISFYQQIIHSEGQLYANYSNIRIMSLREAYLLNFDYIIFAGYSFEEFYKTPYNNLLPGFLCNFLGFDHEKNNEIATKQLVEILASSSEHLFITSKNSINDAEVYKTELFNIERKPLEIPNFTLPKKISIKDLERFTEDTNQVILEKCFDYLPSHSLMNYGSTNEFKLTIRKIIYHIFRNFKNKNSYKYLFRSSHLIAQSNMNAIIYEYYKLRLNIAIRFLYSLAKNASNNNHIFSYPLNLDINNINIKTDIDIINQEKTHLIKIITSTLPSKKSIVEGKYLPAAFYSLCINKPFKLELIRLTSGVIAIEKTVVNIDEKTIEKSKDYIEKIIENYLSINSISNDSNSRYSYELMLSNLI